MAVLRLLGRSRSEGAVGHVGLAALMTFGCAAASILLQGYHGGTGNNSFHLPIAMSLFDRPQFAADAYMQSLRGYTSVVWVGVRWLGAYVDPAAALPALHLASRWLLYGAVMFVLRRWLGLSVPAALVCLAALAVSPAFKGASPVGQTGLQIRYFSHSELATPIMLLALFVSGYGRPVAGAALAGLAFNLNAFMGVWTVAIVGLFLLVEHPPRQLVRAAAVFIGMAAPTAAWNYLTIDTTHIDYPAFLRSYFPQHFFLDSATPASLLQLAGAVLAGTAAIPLNSNFSARRHALAIMWAGALAVFAVGVAAPYLTDSRTVLNLHLLRADGLILLLALINLAGAGYVLWAERHRPECAAALASIAAAVIVGSWWLIGCAAALAWAAERGIVTRLMWLALFLAAAAIDVIGFATGRFGTVAVGLAAIAALAAASALPPRGWIAGALALMTAAPVIARDVDEQRAFGWLSLQRPYWVAWQDVQRWARDVTPSDAMFAVPLDMRLIGFQVGSHRRVWVDLRQGAAAMWRPSFYAIWNTRVGEVRALPTVETRLAYACAHGITHLVEWRADAEGWPLAYRNDHFGVIRVGCR